MMEKNRALSQWYTPKPLAEKVVSWALEGCKGKMSILEPSAGIGALIEPIPSHHDVDAFEIDHANIAYLQQYNRGLVYCTDFLSCDLTREYDLAIANPPYERGLDISFVERVIVDRVARCGVFILRSVFLCGVNRWDRIWRHVAITRLAYLTNRPRFSELSGSPRHDFIVVELVRRDSPLALGDPCAPLIEWWQI
jgi:predicted RNA methylase